MLSLHLVVFILKRMHPKSNFLWLQTKQPDELEQLLEAVTVNMETAASTADLSTARQGLTSSMERLRESLVLPAPADSCSNAGKTKSNVRENSQTAVMSTRTSGPCGDTVCLLNLFL